MHACARGSFFIIHYHYSFNNKKIVTVSAKTSHVPCSHKNLNSFFGAIHTPHSLVLFWVEDLQPCKIMTNILAPLEYTNWVLSAWNSTLDQPLWPSCMVRAICGQLCHLMSSPGVVFPPPSPPPTPLTHPTHPPLCNAGLKSMKKA